MVNRAKMPPREDIISKQCEQASGDKSADAQRENKKGGVKLNLNESWHQSWLLQPWRCMFLITALKSMKTDEINNVIGTRESSVFWRANQLSPWRRVHVDAFMCSAAVKKSSTIGETRSPWKQALFEKLMEWMSSSACSSLAKPKRCYCPGWLQPWWTLASGGQSMVLCNSDIAPDSRFLGIHIYIFCGLLLSPCRIS